MSNHFCRAAARFSTAFSIAALLGASPIVARTEPAIEPVVASSVGALAPTLNVGDVVFIRVAARPFREVAAATDSWTNHVGIVTDTSGHEPLIAESTFPLSRTTRLSKFVARSDGGRVAVARLKTPLTAEQRQQIVGAAKRRSGIFYDTGFDLHSRRQFCSRYVREVIEEATGVHVGEVETFAALLTRRPQTDLGFWRLWYFGQIPWQRETVTPASLLRSPELVPVFDGAAV
ncbi:MAG: YebB family permuted papain-like enzyme [Burkholderiales bacterium]